MTKSIFLACAVAGVLALPAIPVAAHHSFGAEYDANQPITLTGVVTKIEWTNPHSFIYMDETDKSGKVANWKFEGYGAGALYRNGAKKDVTRKPGARTTIFG